MIKLEKVSKTYRLNGSVVNALVDVSLHIESGDFVSITGPSGSGKSTLLLTMGGLNRPDSGKIYLDGSSIYEVKVAEKTRIRRDTIGFLFQTFNLIPYLTALENVQVPLYLSGKDKAEQEKRAKELLEQVGLADRMCHKPAKLSVGQQQRVAMARALANNPKIILADEPTGNLDPDLTAGLMKHFKELNQEKSVSIVMVTHDHTIAREASRQLRLAEGIIGDITGKDS